MTAEQIKNDIKFSLQAFASGHLTTNALKLFQTLGYVTERQAPLHKPTFAEFKETYIADKKLDEIKAKASEWKFVDLLFQLSKEEVLKQTSLFDTKKVNSTIIETYLFFAIELSKKQYSRTELSLITREVNRLFPMPAMILFRHGSSLTLSVINRRLHKRDESKDVLEKVTLIKDINTESPHRAHIEILFDLSFDELKEKYQFTNFVELHNSWQKTLDTKLLNKRFFEELSNWYFWTQSYVEFPNDRKIEEDRNIQINLIRLITRLIFVWFLREKKLVPDKLFDKGEIKKLLKNFDSEGETTKNYYTAILQNLFFGTLNQKMNERGFIVEGKYEENRNQYGVKTLYRYADQFDCTKDEVISLFKDIPFLNGGLFDCLDKENEDTGKVEYIDGFSRNAKKVPTLPDLLFFGRERIEDLSEGYGYKRSNEKCRGILELFSDYKFTIEENTPIEEEIALDPELLGKVFENLLAYYTPETENTARKQTGSFYTPREIVNYMVDESLIAYLKTQMLEERPTWLQLGNLQTEMFGNEFRKGQLKIQQNLNANRWKHQEDELENNLRKLIAYNNDDLPFETEEDIQYLIYAIDHCKILDPACGSGAFPMGVLHKLVYVLGRLDSGNIRWRELQKRKAQNDIDKALNDIDKKEREKKLIDINENFEDNASDYGRKLYLIENCIYGVDIQPIAVQISKLRFFISLVVDQKEKKGDNRGIRPLPNLETKFVAANTLIGLEKPKQAVIKPTKFYDLEKELESVRHKHFESKTRKEKITCQKKDKTIRKEISELLKDSGWNSKDADKIAQFDIYDQNQTASWFEPEWMFGKDLVNGFGIVIGNPPYVDIKSLPKDDVKLYFQLFKTTENRINLYSIFIEKGISLLNEKGILTYINPNSILINESYKKIRKHIVDGVERIVKLPDSVFEAATVETIILITRKKSLTNNVLGVYFGKNDVITFDKLLFNSFERSEWKRDNDSRFSIFSDHKANQLLRVIEAETKTLETYLLPSLGITPYDKYKGHSESLITNREFHSSKKLSKQYVPLISGKNIHHYYISNEIDEYLKYGEWLGAPREKKFFENPKIIVRQILSGNKLRIVAGYSDTPHYFTQIGFSLISKTGNVEELKFILCLLNSHLISFYHKNKFLDIEKVVFQKILIANCKVLPIRISNYQKTFSHLVDYVLELKKKTRDSNFYERLIEAMVYELYLPEAIRSAKCEIAKHLNNLPALKDDENEENLKTIEKVYKELSDPKHPVSASMFKMDTIEEISIIEGKK